MNVQEYTSETKLSVAEILKKCNELGIDATDKESMLSEDDIIILDNAISIADESDEESFDVEDEMDDVVSDIMEDQELEKLGSGISKQKLKKRSEIVNSKTEYLKNRKEMYKNKGKLQGNKTEENVVFFTDQMTVQDLAEALNIQGTELIKKLMGLGLMVALNQAIDFENASIITMEYNKTLKKAESTDVSNFEEFEIIDDEENLSKRPPVVTIMGHVDHGKTSLLDTIRKSQVVDSEFGGITQHIGAYQVENNGNKITFIDTPGHAAFTEMRARGASITDIVIIIVAADDGVKPQTKEAVEHALAANAPIIVAVNKIDKPDANVDRVMTEMAELNITPEAWGGTIPFVNLSALTGEGIDLLLETISTVSEMLELKSNPNRYAIGTVVESKFDKNVGGIISMIIQTGTLRLGDPLVVGTFAGKVRTLKNDLGESIVEAGPSTPVEITGINGNPSAGDKFMAYETETEAKSIAIKRENIAKESKFKKSSLSLDDLFAKINSGIKEINVVLKADVRGSEEAVKNSLESIEVEGVRVKVIRSGIGAITESDVVLANASEAIIIGFNVVPSPKTKEIAKEYNVDMRLYTIIYKAVEEMESAMKGLLDPEFEEKNLGTAEIRKIFKFSKVGQIAGTYVTDGVIKSNSKMRLIRDGVIIHEGKIASVQREKDTVKEVKKGYECGITLESYSDIKEQDIIEAYEIVEVKR